MELSQLKSPIILKHLLVYKASNYTVIVTTLA